MAADASAHQAGQRPETPMESPEYEPLYLAGIAHFNACDFFESHEVWEELWTDYQGPSRKFYQGLIQTAVALHHFGNGNIRGAKKLFVSSHNYLAPYRPRHLGLDVDKLLDDMANCFTEVMASREEYPKLALDPERIPEIHLDPPPAA
jgi:predicted metal-dependent hydrolase